MGPAQFFSTQIASPDDMAACGRDAAVQERNVINLAPAPARFRAFPDDIWIALKRDQPVTRVGPILQLVDGYVIARLAAGTVGEECPRDIDHMRRALELVEQWRPAPRAEASGRLCLRILEASHAS